MVDPDDATKVLGTDEPGELQVRGPQVFSGYWGKAEATDEVFTPTAGSAPATSWRSTPTASSGSSTASRSSSSPAASTSSPTEVEDTLLKHPSVTEVAVVGITQGGNEQVVAAVVPKDPATFDGAALRA